MTYSLYINVRQSYCLWKWLDILYI